MGRRVVLVGLAGCAMLLATACDGGSPSQGGATPSMSVVTTASPTPDWWTTPLLRETEDSWTVVVPEQRGETARRLPALTVRGGEPIQMVVICSGPGRLRISVNGGKPVTVVKCDQVRSFVDLHVEPGKRAVELKPDAGVRWKVAVVDR